jgi:hypothetical protein
MELEPGKAWEARRLRGGGLVVPHNLGLSRNWRVVGSRGKYPGGLWDQLGTGVRHGQGQGSQCGVGLAQGWGLGDPAMHGYNTGLWPGSVRGVESLVERSSGSAGLCGRELAGRLFFYYIVAWRRRPWSKCLECLFFWLSLVLYLSQVCLQLLSRVSDSGAHEVCGSVSVTILDHSIWPLCWHVICILVSVCDLLNNFCVCFLTSILKVNTNRKMYMNVVCRLYNVLAALPLSLITAATLTLGP